MTDAFLDAEIVASLSRAMRRWDDPAGGFEYADGYRVFVARYEVARLGLITV